MTSRRISIFCKHDNSKVDANLNLLRITTRIPRIKPTQRKTEPRDGAKSRLPLHCRSSWIQPFLNLSTMDFEDTQDSEIFFFFFFFFCFSKLAFGHLGLRGLYAFGNLTQGRAEGVITSLDSLCGLLPPDTLQRTLAIFQSSQGVTLFV